MSETSYARLRSRVLFEIWAPGTDSFVAKFVMCRRCGFVCFAPRPTAAELDAKYRLLNESRSPRLPVKPIDLQRSALYFETLKPHLNGRRELLDFGGGRGVLLKSFVEHGMDCSVVDYAPGTVDGVTRLGNTLADVPPGRRFDVVLSSHVFEHLADPLQTAIDIRQVLRAGGLLFVEVPLELLGRVHKTKDPVTHINFFTPASLRVLLARAGFEVVHCRQERSLFAIGKYRQAVRALARVTDSPPPLPLPGCEETRRLLKLRLIDKVSLRANRARKHAIHVQKRLGEDFEKFKKRVRRRLSQLR